MSVQPATSRDALVARSVVLKDPGSLLDALPEPGISWVRRGEGMVAWGEVVRSDTVGANRITDAQEWWEDVSRRAIVRDDADVRGSGLVAFGSFAFADGSEDQSALVVPRYVLGRRDGVAWLTVVSETASIATPTLAEVQEGAVVAKPLSAVEVDVGEEAVWKAAVDLAIARIDAGEIDKVVLAREVDARAAEAIDVRTLLTSLAANYPTCWTFHVDGMVGATPELLARVDQGLVTSRVLAGTIRPTGDEQADLAHAAALARSSKDREEHEFAVRSVTEVLARFCSSINVPEAPSVIHLPNVMHLASDVTGVLSGTATSLELVRALHPSAAVCGTPRDAASRVIADLETIDRGRYAGPVGWIDASGDGEWCIALRAAEVDADDPTHLRLFAGCGIVAASDAHAEWEESEAKLEPLRSALRG